MKVANKSTSILKTEFLEGQGLGNQLWVYASGKAIAKKLGRPHVCAGLARFKGRGFLEITSDQDPDPNGHVQTFYEKVFYDEELEFFSSTYDERVYSAPDRALINGLFQSERYLSEHIWELSDWIKPSESVNEKARLHQHTCVINIRGGEYKRHKRLILPDRYWSSALQQMKNLQSFNDILVVSDDLAYAELMFPGFPVLHGGVEECYAALMGAKCVILGNSSFAYFPIKTRHDCPFIIAPENWARFGDPAGRWAMPSNCYKGWKYLTRDGELLRYEDCLAKAEADANYYELNFNIRISKNSSIGGFKTRFIPKIIKSPIKRLLSRLLPRYF